MIFKMRIKGNMFDRYHKKVLRVTTSEYYLEYNKDKNSYNCYTYMNGKVVLVNDCLEFQEITENVKEEKWIIEECKYEIQT
jgi:hypothetical protein